MHTPARPNERTTMNYAEIKYCDIANGVGVRTTLFVSGCRHGCPGCFNAAAWDFLAGKPFDAEVQHKLLESLSTPYVDGLSILGGEPLEPENQEALAPFLAQAKSVAPSKDIWMWTGFTWEQLMGKSRAHTSHINEILDYVDVLVDGPFVEAQKDLTLRFRGSSNQRIIDVAESRTREKVILWQDEAIFSSHSW